MGESQPNPVIDVQGLSAEYQMGSAAVTVVDNVSFRVQAGEVLGMAGESGCGKSTIAYALLGFSRPGCRIRAGRIIFEGRNLLTEDYATLQAIRGDRISLVSQNPATALTPSIRVGQQIAEVLVTHRGETSRHRIRQRVLELLGDLGLRNPEAIAQRYPHQLSGGQQQRVVLATALACRPRLIVLDEPTTGLDVTTQARIIQLLSDLRAKHKLAMVYVTHDLRLLRTISDRLAVLYAGTLVETGPTERVFQSPKHPYTKGLIAAIPTLEVRPTGAALRGLLRRNELPDGCPFAPRCAHAEARCVEMPQQLDAVAPQHLVACWKWERITHDEERSSATYPASPPVISRERFLGPIPAADGAPSPALLFISDLECGYPRLGFTLFPPPPAPVVRGVSFSISPNETFALVGETGSGKSTIARSVAGLLPPLGGRLVFDGVDVSRRRLREHKRRIQIVFQNPDASLNPQHRVLDIVGRPLEYFFALHGSARQQKVAQILHDVRLDASHMRKYPFQLSGGERQRVALARALAAEPELLVCDEILSALDVSVQAAILDLLTELRGKRRLACLFITHDLAVVRWFADRVGVLDGGVICETGEVEELFAAPRHPYTRALLQASSQTRRGGGVMG